jgi:hypothetical protein
MTLRAIPAALTDPSAEPGWMASFIENLAHVGWAAS